MLRKLVAIACVVACAAVDARQGAQPVSQTSARIAPAPVVGLTMRDADALLAEDAKAPRGTPLRFAQALSVNVTPARAGRWQQLGDGTWLWSIEFAVPGATDLNFALGAFRLPPHAQLHVIGADGYYQGPYTAADDAKSGALWLPVVPGERARLELHVADRNAPLKLAVTRVNAGYRDLFHGGMAKSGSCNIDVACPVADPWRNQVRSVARISISGSFLCTATLLHDATASGKPLMLSAAHCGVTASEAPSVVAYWNYEAAQCGGARNGSLSQNQSGATFRARRTDVDSSLFELDAAPDPAFHVYFAGWDRGGAAPGGSVTIHHPGGDEKAFTLNDDPLATVDSCIGSGVQTHWQVDNYEQGTTEPGSSGAALFDPANQRVVGFLSGGDAACTVPQGGDCYGKVAVAWDGASADVRLKDWLDPGNSGVSFVDGGDTPGALVAVGTRFADVCGSAPQNGVAQPGETLDLYVKLKTTADASAITGTLTTSSPGVTIVSGSANWPALAAGGAAENTTPLRIAVAGDATCPAPIALTLATSGTGLDPQQIPLSVALGGGSADGNGNVAIPDGTGAAASRALVMRAGPLTHLVAHVKIAHSWVGDLKLVLRHPSGAQVVLLDRPGVPADPFGCGDDDMDVRFSDDATTVLENLCPGTKPWFAGDAKPVNALSSLASLSAKGTWQLVVTDAQDGDSGAIESFAIEADELQHCAVCDAAHEPKVLVTPAGDVNGDGKPDLAVLVQPAGELDTVRVRNGDGGEIIRTFQFNVGAAVAMASLPDLDGNGAPELAALGVFSGDGLIDIRNARAGARVGSRIRLTAIDPIGLAVYADDSAQPFLAVLGRRTADRRGIVRFLSTSGSVVATALLEPGFVPRALTVLPKAAAGQLPRIAILGERAERPRVLVYVAASTQPVASFFAQDTGQEAVAISPAGDGTALAILALDPVASRGSVQVRSAAGAQLLARNLIGGYRPLAVYDVGDTENSGSHDLALVSLDVNGRALSQLINSTLGTVRGNHLFAGAGETRAATLTPSLLGAGPAQIAIVRRTAASPALRVEARDATSGGLAAYYAVGN